MIIRPVQDHDIDGIMALERETFGGEVSEQAMASRKTMEHRIELYTKIGFEGFWVAEHNTRIFGDIIFHPTAITPQECSSWARATDNGNIIGALDRNGSNMYVTSLAVSKKAPTCTAELLAHTSFIVWLREQKKHYMFCSRMPGFKETNIQTGIRAEDYWQSTNQQGEPLDWMIRMYYYMVGAGPSRFLLDGFPPDKESGGHGVLFAPDNPVRALQSIAQCMALAIPTP